MRPEKGIQEQPLTLAAVNAGDGSVASIDVRQATKVEAWAQLNRLLTFEEPLAKAQRSNQLLSRHSDITLKQFNQLSRPSQIEIFNLTYGASQQAKFKEARLLSALLALSDMARFESLAFDVWLHATAGGGSLSKSANNNFSSAEAAWLDLATQAVPNFDLVYEAGPWHNDARVDFLIAVLNDLGKSTGEFSTAQLPEAKLIFDNHLANFRKQLPTSFLPNLVCLVEGATEAILLPHFALALGVDFQELGILVIPAGGAKQAARRYLELKDICKLPVVVVLDRDAKEEAEVVSEMVRDCDHLHVLAAGEVEDIYDTGLFIELINKYLGELRSTQPVTVAEIEGSLRRTATVSNLWRSRSLGDFDKIGFAKSVATHTLAKQSVPNDAQTIIKSMQNLLEKFGNI
jgi:hypothetical protein